jgi:hypothetical protein
MLNLGAHVPDSYGCVAQDYLKDTWVFTAQCRCMGCSSITFTTAINVTLKRFDTSTKPRAATSPLSHWGVGPRLPHNDWCVYMSCIIAHGVYSNLPIQSLSTLPYSLPPYPLPWLLTAQQWRSVLCYLILSCPPSRMQLCCCAARSTV